MARTLHISHDLTLPLDTVTSTLIVYGGKGMGKTNLLAVVLEEMSKVGLRWCSIDPIGVHYGLRHSADGRGLGVTCLILGGVHGDIPIEPTGGEVVADLVADENVNVIIDCSRHANGQMWSVGERTRFITAFALRLFQRQGSLVDGKRREPVFLALDEAARYIPQTIPAGNPDLAKSLGAWEQLVEEGRNVGIGVGLFTQRSARLNKSVAELADVMIAFRTVGPNSIRAVMEWLGEHVAKERIRELIGLVRSVDRGTALVVSPGWLRYEGVVAIRARETFDSSATPKPGEQARRIVGVGATVDLDAYQARMAETIQRAKADDPKALRAEAKQLATDRDRLAVDRDSLQRAVDSLTAELASRPVTVEVPPLDTSAILKAMRAGAEGAALALHDHMEQMVAAVSRTLASIEEQRKTAPAPQLVAKVAQTARQVRTERAPVAPQTRPAPQSTTPGAEPDASLGKAERAILTALAQHGARPTVRLAHLAGYSPRGGAYNRTLTALRGAGYIEAGSAGIGVTQAGLDALGAYEPMPTGRELVDHWLARVGTAQAKILTALGDVYPDPLGRDDLAARCDYSAVGGAFNRAITALRKVELIDGPGNAMRLAEDLGDAWR